jgi:hypothetical protein
VLRTEIQPSQDRVTVVGDVDAKVLVRKLAKVGKIAEVLPPPPSSDENGKKREDGEKPPAAEEEEKSGGGGKSAGDEKPAAFKQECKKCAHGAAGDKKPKEKPPSCKDAEAAAADDKNANESPSSAPDHAVQQHYHRAEPAMAVPVHVPYYGYYAAPAPVMMVRRAPQQPSRFDADYFNDDNTVGCSVM